MKTLFFDFSINYAAIWSDLSIYVCLWLVAFVLITVWAAKNYKNSIREEYLTKTTSKLCAMAAEIDQLTAERDHYKSAFDQYYKDINAELIETRSKIQKRNPNGTFAITSGKGHGKKKEVKQVEIDWTKATKKELLAEAKRRYPIGTKIRPIFVNVERILKITNNNFTFFTLLGKDNNITVSSDCGTGTIVENGVCIFCSRGEWAKIIK